MPVTAIVIVSNLSDRTVDVWNQERPSCRNQRWQSMAPHSDKDLRSLPPEENPTCGPGGIWIPWCSSWGDFRNNQNDRYLTVMVDDQRRTYCIWQHRDTDGDFVRAVDDFRFHGTNDGLEGVPAPHIGGDASVGGNRRLIIRADGSIALAGA
jgi:hypothetical protein